MSKGYLIAHLKEHDQEGMEKFKQMAGPTIGEHGGKVLVREPSPDVREGENLGTVVLIEFESIDAARKFYESEKWEVSSCQVGSPFKYEWENKVPTAVLYFDKVYVSSKRPKDLNIENLNDGPAYIVDNN